MSPLMIVAVAVVLFLAAGIYVVARMGTRLDAGLERRVGMVAAVLGGGAAAKAETHQASVFRSRRRKSRLHERLERRFSLLEGRRAFPKAVAVGFLVAVGAVATAAFMHLWPFVPVLAPAAWAAGSWAFLAVSNARKRSEFGRRFPDVVDHVVRLTRAGLPAVESIAVVAEDAPEPVRSLLREVADEMASGLDPEVVLRGMAARVRIPEFTLFSAALCLQRTTGGGISAALGSLSATLRARLEVEMKAHASTAQTRITLLVLSGVPVLVLAAQSVINPQAVETLFDSPLLLRWGVGLIVGGVVIAHAIAARFGK